MEIFRLNLLILSNINVGKFAMFIKVTAAISENDIKSEPI